MTTPHKPEIGALPWNDDTYTFSDYKGDLMDAHETEQNDRVILETGTHIDSHWGHYQGQRIIELANALGWPDPEPKITEQLLAKYPDLDPKKDEQWYWDESVQEANDWIDENCTPEGYWFGHHADIGDVGVWEIEEE